MKKRSIFILLFLSAGMLASCAAGPDFTPPEPPQVSDYTPYPLPSNTASSPGILGGTQSFVTDGNIPAEWWRKFGSAKLDALIEKALKNSPTLEAAAATLRQAREFYEAKAGSTLYPQVAGNLGAQRQGINSAPSGLPGGERTFSLFNAGVGVSYDFDLAGGNRRILESLAAQVDYQHFVLEGARLTLAANVATVAVLQAQLLAQISATQDIVSAQEEQLSLTRQRLRLGSATPKEELALQIQLETTRAAIPLLRSRQAAASSLLATLAGVMPGEKGFPQFNLGDFVLPSELPLRIPSELARRRPDIRGAEALLHAAGAQYGASLANVYPKITLNANLASQALTTATLFGGSSLVWGIAGQLLQPLFNGGLRAEARAAKAGMDAARANYQQTILQSFRNVADILRALEDDAAALALQTGAYESAVKSLLIIQQEYSMGAVGYLQILIARQQADQLRIAIIESQSKRLAGTIALYQAMGGGI
ncbi:MAG: efflux transporter outer membrane subunit [Syntrophales bacterium]